MDGGINTKNTEAALDKFGKYLVREARKNLTRKKKSNTKGLYKSLDYEVKAMPNSINFDFLMEEYGEWVDKGRKAGKMPPVSAIEKWVSQRKIQFRDNKGRFETYRTTAFIIAQSIKKRGIPATNFYSRPFKLGFNRLPPELTQAYALDLEDFLDFTLNELNVTYKNGSK
jgi:hypothetical protein